MTHRIRLAGPWESQELEAFQSGDAEGVRCELPFSCTADNKGAGVVLIRRFHCPTGIDDSSKLRIICRASMQPESAKINGESLTEVQSDGLSEFRYDVTGRVRSFNELSVTLLAPGNSNATMEMVWLEIAD